MKRVFYLIPVALLLVLGGFLYWGLNEDRNPNAIPSAIVGKSLPTFQVVKIEGYAPSEGFSNEDLEDIGQPVLVNFFASWCVPCRAEHAVISRFSKETGIPLWGVNYRDEPRDAIKWLNELGNPYVQLGADSGRAAIEFGLAGVPETYLIDASGKVAHAIRGPIVNETALSELRDAIEQLK